MRGVNGLMALRSEPKPEPKVERAPGPEVIVSAVQLSKTSDFSACNKRTGRGMFQRSAADNEQLTNKRTCQATAWINEPAVVESLLAWGMKTALPQTDTARVLCVIGLFALGFATLLAFLFLLVGWILSKAAPSTLYKLAEICLGSSALTLCISCFLLTRKLRNRTGS